MTFMLFQGQLSQNFKFENNYFASKFMNFESSQIDSDCAAGEKEMCTNLTERKNVSQFTR